MTHDVENAVHPHAQALKHSDGSWKYTNALADEASPYLLQHAHNPVDWYAWGERAFAKAREEDKPIFLSVGYSTCYWCHVMERQVFENPAIAEQMNAHFVNVKVDREERPDVDELYMTATQMMTAHGGWPMSVFLTPPGAKGEGDPGLRPFWAGTYLPPEPGHGMPSFPQVLEGLSRAWGEQRQEVLEQADRVAEAVQEQLEHRDLSGPLHTGPIERAANQLLQLYDHQHGGFGGAPKFPQPANLAFLLALHRHTGDREVRAAVRHTLDRMARGGIYDQVGGGFHRYSVDEKWLVPHFEKMLYDNGQLIELYCAALAEGRARHEPDPTGLDERVIRQSCDYVLREMTDASGAFWSAQDAEVDGREGGNYLWTREQVEQAIGEEGDLAALAVKMYGLDQGTNFRDPHHPDAEPANVLYLPRPLAELAEELGEDLPRLMEKRRHINAKLKAVRDQRPQPGTDDKVLTAWNGMMIAALAEAGRTLEEPTYLEAAGRAAGAILEHMTDSEDPAGTLAHTMRQGQRSVPGFLADYAFFVHGLLALHRAGRDDRPYLDLARQLTEAAAERFTTGRGGYYDTLADQRDLFVRLCTIHDGVIPSGNSQMVHNLLDLYELTDEPAHLDQAVRDLGGFGKAIQQQGAAMVHMQHALLRVMELAPDRLVSEQPPDHPTAEAGPPEPVQARVQPERLDLSPGEASFEVALDVEGGYHLNAGDPGTPGARDLAPTSLELTGASRMSLSVEYPEGEPREFAYADQSLSVYEGRVVLKATLYKTGSTVRVRAPKLLLRYQPCTDRACQSPRTQELPIQLTGV